MSKPKRIQRKRTRGWLMPPNTVYVGRPTFWGNPFKVNNIDFDGITAKGAVEAYRNYLPGLLKSQTEISLESLRGKNLACWCPLDQPCHADVLLELANVRER